MIGSLRNEDHENENYDHADQKAKRLKVKEAQPRNTRNNRTYKFICTRSLGAWMTNFQTPEIQLFLFEKIVIYTS